MNHPVYYQEFSKQYQADRIQVAQRERAVRQDRPRPSSLKWLSFQSFKPVHRLLTVVLNLLTA
jgi:hypothetical protein